MNKATQIEGEMLKDEIEKEIDHFELIIGYEGKFNLSDKENLVKAILELVEKEKKCQYEGCNERSDIGYYCWEHNPYFRMNDPKEQQKLEKHNLNQKEGVQ